MDNKDVYGQQQKLSFIEFITELPNFFAVTASAILTGSLISWMDFVDSLGNVICCGFVSLLSKKLKRNLKYEYNYGIGKIEAIASLCCEFFMIFGLLCVCFFSAMELIEPKRPSDLLFIAVLLKVANVGFDTYFLIRQRKISKTGGRIAQSEYKGMIQAIAFDAIALISLFVCYIYRDIRAMWYFSPVLCLVISVYFFIDSASRIRSAIRELIDRTLPEDKQLLILKALNSCYKDYANLVSVNSHISGGTVFIDLNVSFEDDTSYCEMQAFLRRVTEMIHADIADSVVHIIISE